MVQDLLWALWIQSTIWANTANFLDVGGSANAETVAKGFEIILKNPNVKAIFVNIFGGIVRCDRIANGILEATKACRCTCTGNRKA